MFALYSDNAVVKSRCICAALSDGKSTRSQVVLISLAASMGLRGNRHDLLRLSRATSKFSKGVPRSSSKLTASAALTISFDGVPVKDTEIVISDRGRSCGRICSQTAWEYQYVSSP